MDDTMSDGAACTGEGEEKKEGMSCNGEGKKCEGEGKACEGHAEEPAA